MISSTKKMLDRAVDKLGRQVDGRGADAVAVSLAKFFPGGMPALLDRLREAGHGEAVESWIATGPNADALVEHLAGVLPPDTAKAMAWDLGIPERRLPAALVQFLPVAVDQASPEGALYPRHAFSAADILRARSAARETSV